MKIMFLGWFACLAFAGLQGFAAEKAGEVTAEEILSQYLQAVQDDLGPNLRALVFDLKYTDVGIYALAGLRWVRLGKPR
jgi:hypothetical protein